jgi:hypothetical protein
MPTPNGLIFPFEFMDQQLQAKGIEGYVDPLTGLFVVRDNEPARQLLTTRQVHPRNYSGSARRRPAREDLV